MRTLASAIPGKAIARDRTLQRYCVAASTEQYTCVRSGSEAEAPDGPESCSKMSGFHLSTVHGKPATTEVVDAGAPEQQLQLKQAISKAHKACGDKVAAKASQVYAFLALVLSQAWRYPAGFSVLNEKHQQQDVQQFMQEITYAPHRLLDNIPQPCEQSEKGGHFSPKAFSLNLAEQQNLQLELLRSVVDAFIKAISSPTVAWRQPSALFARVTKISLPVQALWQSLAAACKQRQWQRQGILPNAAASKAPASTQQQAAAASSAQFTEADKDTSAAIEGNSSRQLSEACGSLLLEQQQGHGSCSLQGIKVALKCLLLWQGVSKQLADLDAQGATSAYKGRAAATAARECGVVRQRSGSGPIKQGSAKRAARAGDRADVMKIADQAHGAGQVMGLVGFVASQDDQAVLMFVQLRVHCIVKLHHMWVLPALQLPAVGPLCAYEDGDNRTAMTNNTWEASAVCMLSGPNMGTLVYV
ncbi:hypothetical protein COO60DRAFT_1469849 [Scenedesmus sp. NREL 46B-D3]|nr:hypothetical protein COO60DRAFT_1469849 [Scenedesmus sp. NREL 46B-D3]